MPILPTIHLNGTSRASLQSGYDAAADSLHDFITNWGQIEFNPRDYYVTEGAWEQARDERDAMASKIRDVQAYLQDIRVHLYND